MKNFWIFSLVLGTSVLSRNTVFAQFDTLHLYQTYQSFSNPEKAEWTAFENNWNFVEYSLLKQNNKIKALNCKNCESFYADMYLEINDVGQLTTVAFVKGKKCGLIIMDKPSMIQFENALKPQTFRSLKNKRFIARFGHILKC